MEDSSPIAFIIILITCIVSYRGLRSIDFMDRYVFRVDDILKLKDYKRLFTSGFLHVSWGHLLLNMLTLYFFSSEVEYTLGIGGFLLVYFGSLIGGDLFSLFIHRHDADYSSLGASGAISGVIFAAIAIFPGMKIMFLFIPIPIPVWAYGLAYVAYSIYGIRSMKNRIGHDAHLGGGIAGLLIAIGLVPSSLLDNYIPILLVFIPSCIFMYLIISRPAFLYLEKPFAKSGLLTMEDRYNDNRRKQEKELNAILDKISKSGLNSLSKKEKEKLEKYSG
jgi:membrane associated rhomboid family serine protease